MFEAEDAVEQDKTPVDECVLHPPDRSTEPVDATGSCLAPISGGEFEKISPETTSTEEFDMFGQQYTEEPSRMNRRDLDLLEEKFQAACLKTASKTAEITQRAGGSIELYGYELVFPSGAVEVNEDVELSVDNNPNLYPKSLMPISLIIGCKPSKFKKPVKVRLASWLRPRDGRDMKVVILSRSTSQMEWKEIKESTLTTSGFIEYEVTHFCKNVAVITDEEVRRGLIHFYNDVRMNSVFGYILSFLCRERKSLEEWVRELDRDHKRIIAFPTEIDIPLDGYVNMEISCINTPAMKMNPGCKFPVKIYREGLKIRNKYDFYFRPQPLPSKSNHTGPYVLEYIIKVEDSQHVEDIEASCTIPLNYQWTPTQQFHNQIQDAGDAQSVEPRQQGLSKKNPEMKSFEGPDTSQKPQDRTEATGVNADVVVIKGSVVNVVAGDQN